MSSPKTLFQDKRPDILSMDDLYDPDSNTSGTIIPTVGSVLVGTNEYSRILFTITEVDPITHKSTYKPLSVLAQENEEDITSIVDYNNTRFKIFYDTRVSPTKLNIDSLLVIFGMQNEEYRLRRFDPVTKEDQIISIYYDSNGNYKGNRIPLKPLGTTNAKYCSNCHTLVELIDDDKITMEVFDHIGTMTAEITLFAQKAVILNDYGIPPIITDFALEGIQIKDDAFYLYEKQDISALCISPTITYNDGTKALVPIDEEVCFLYGTEDLISSYPGLRQTILCKYYLRSDQLAEGAIDTRRGRYVYAEKDVVILPNNTIFGCKISILPIWNNIYDRYDLKFFMYTTDRDTVYDVSNNINILTDYNPKDFDNEQLVTYSVDMQQLLNLDNESTYVQSTWLRLKPYNTTVERYIIKDSAHHVNAYGVENSTYRRPVIHYDHTLNQYYIPNSIFTNVEAFVEVAYEKANPPFNTANEIEPPTPTHFTIRSVETAHTLISAPIPLENYNQAWNAITTNDLTLVNQTVIVEFVREIGNTYQIIYGVPVDVYRSETGYNEE
jgi:hypothetical protein